MPDYQMNLYRGGKGAPPLVFVHGLLCRYQDWSHQLDRFASAHRVLACDLRGHGQSAEGDAPITIDRLGSDVASLLESDDLSGAVLFGHSMGCRVVMDAYSKARERVSGLVLVDGSRFATDSAAALAALDAGIAEKGFPAIVEGLFEQMFFGDPPDWKADKMAQVLAIPDRVGMSLLRSMTVYDATKIDTVLASMDVPVLVLQSTTMNAERVRRPLKAGEVPPYPRLLLDRVPGVECEIYADCGHFTMMEQPDAVNDRIARFLRERIAAA